MKTSGPLLAATALSKHFGGLQAVLDYELTLSPGEIVGLIGPNGAGKTTIFNLLSGAIPPSSGNIRLLGRDVTRSRPDVVASLGLARTFQNIRLFMNLSVMENVMAGFHRHHGTGLFSTLLCLPASRRSERAIARRALDILEFFKLGVYAHDPAASLAYGDQRKLEIARALATDPKILLLDEPAAGMNQSESEELLTTIRRLRRELDLTILLVEHDMSVVMRICERIQVLVHGRLLTEGAPAEVQADPRVIEAYLGSPKETKESHAHP